MLVRRALLLIMLLIAGTLAATAFRSNADQRDDHLYNEIVVIKGTVRVVDQATQDTSVRVGAYLIFQRTDCKKCFVAAVTDAEGHYQLRVSRGRYKLIAREGTKEGEMYDVVAVDQPRYVDAMNTVDDNRFDIKLAYPPSQLHRTLPVSPVFSPSP